MVAYAGMKVPQEESFKVQFILHVRFIASSKVCSSVLAGCQSRKLRTSGLDVVWSK